MGWDGGQGSGRQLAVKEYKIWVVDVNKNGDVYQYLGKSRDGFWH